MGEPDEREQLLGGYSGRLFVVVSLGWLFVQLGRQTIPPLLPNIIDDFSITPTAAGFALTLMWALYALFQYPSGRLSDRLSRKTLLVSGLAFLLVGFFALSGSVTYPMFLVGASVVGVGAGLYPTAARALLSDVFVARRGQAFGLHTAAGDLGNAGAAGLAVAAVALATWQGAFLPVAAVFGLTLLALHRWSREPYVFERADLDVVSTVRRLFGTGRFRRLLAAYALFAFTWQSATGFLPSLLQFEKGFSVGLASGGFALYFVVGTVAKAVSGHLSDRFGRLFVSIGALCLGSGGLVVLLFADTVPLVFLGISVFAAGLMAFPPVMQAFFMDVFPTDSMGGDLGAMRTLYIGFGSLGPTYVGYVADVGSYTVAFAGLVACLLVSAAVVLGTEPTG